MFSLLLSGESCGTVNKSEDKKRRPEENMLDCMTHADKSDADSNSACRVHTSTYLFVRTMLNMEKQQAGMRINATSILSRNSPLKNEGSDARAIPIEATVRCTASAVYGFFFPIFRSTTGTNTSIPSCFVLSMFMSMGVPTKPLENVFQLTFPARSKIFACSTMLLTRSSVSRCFAPAPVETYMYLSSSDRKTRTPKLQWESPTPHASCKLLANLAKN